MKTRWLIIGLFLLGLLAAVGAALLVASLREESRRATVRQTQVDVLVATRPLSAMTVVDADAIKTASLPRSEAPQKALKRVDEALGRVLAVSMKDGEPFTEKCFVTEGTGPQIASTIRPGMRAISLSLQDASGLEGLLYPGCMVDVIASVRSPENKDEYVTLPLLQRVQVLAVGDQTVFNAGPEAKTSTGGLRARKLVTLLVEPDQARAIQLASELGSLSLTMRNPFDMDPVNTAPMFVNDVFAGYAAAPLKPAALPTNLAAAPAAPLIPAPALMQEYRRPPEWQVVVIRGNDIKTETFGVSDEEHPVESR